MLTACRASTRRLPPSAFRLPLLHFPAAICVGEPVSRTEHADRATRRSHVLFSHWPIRNKLQLGLGLLGGLGAHAVRQRVLRPVRLPRAGEESQRRSAELPLADKLRDHVAELARNPQPGAGPPAARRNCGARRSPTRADQTLWDADGLLRQTLSHAVRPVLPDARQLSRAARLQPAAAPNRASATTATSAKRWPRSTACWTASSSTTTMTTPRTGCSTTKPTVSQLRDDVETLRELAAELPSHLHDRFRELASDVRNAVPLGDRLAWATTAIGHDPAGGRRAAVPQMDRPAAGHAGARFARSGGRQVRPPHPPRIATTKCASWPRR